MKPFSYAFLILFLVCSCKDKLVGNQEVLQGKWEWEYSYEHIEDLTNGSSTYNKLLASDFPDKYYLEFDRKGKVRHYRNQELLEENRIKFEQFFETSCQFGNNCYLFWIAQNNNENNPLAGTVSTDSLSSNMEAIPLASSTQGAFSYTYEHIFSKSN